MMAVIMDENPCGVAVRDGKADNTTQEEATIVSIITTFLPSQSFVLGKKEKKNILYSYSQRSS